MVSSTVRRKDREGIFCAIVVIAFATVLASSAVALALAGQLTSLDYPQWRGAQRDGAASGFVEPKVWPDVLTRHWKVEVGEGYATPLVIGDTVYVFTRRGGDEGISALNARTGAERWRSTYAAPYTPSKPTAAHGSGPKATPLYLSETLFTLGITGVVTAFDARKGARLWQTPTPPEPPFYSAASSPAGEKGMVFAHPGNYGPLTAFDAKTGAIRWTSSGDGLYASPIVVDLGGVRQVVSVLQESVIGVAADDGRLLWRYPWKGLGGSTTPLLNGDTIVLSGLDMGVTAIKPAVRDGTWSVEERWKTSGVSSYLSNAVVVDRTIFGLSHRESGQFFALDAATGDVLWLGAPREATNTAVVKAGRVLFFLNDDAELIVARASRTGFEPLKRYTVADGATWAQPVISGNRIFVKDVSSLTLWTVDERR
jgi:outer membrane protein assembly factor BamB